MSATSIMQNSNAMSASKSNLDAVSSDIGADASFFNGSAENLKNTWCGTGCEFSSNACRTLFTAMVQVSKIVSVMGASTNKVASVMREVDANLSSGFKG